MKAIWKGFIIGIVLIAIGAGIIITTLAVNGWSVKIKYEMKTYTAEQENSVVEIDVGASELKCEFYDGDKIEITYPESKSFKTRIKETDGKLKFENDIKWYASFLTITSSAETVIKLPQSKVFDLKINIGAGTVSIAEGVYGKVKIDVSAGTLKADGVTCDTIDCDVSAGKLDITALTCPSISADVSAGTLKIGVIGNKSDYTIRADVSAGSCNVDDQTGNTDKRLDVDCSAGTITVNFNG